MFDATTTHLFPLLADTAVRGAALLAVAGLVTLALWRASAALRHLVWSTALVGLLALPVLHAAAPAWPVLPGPGFMTTIPTATAAPIPTTAAATTTPSASSTWPSTSRSPASSAAESSVPLAPTSFGPAGEGSETAGRAGGLAATPSRSSSLPISRTWLLGLWAAGVLLLLAPMVAGWLAVRRLGGRSRPLEDVRVRRLATRLALRIELRRPFRLLVGPSRIMPMTWGLVRPKVVLPPEALEWPRPRLEAVLLHELAHVARRDCLTQTVGELARAVHWFNPLVWVAVRRLRVERERACDDVALAGGARASEYAEELLGLARTLQASRATTMAAVAMARPGQLSDRLLAVLDEHRSRGGVGGRVASRTAALSVAVVLPLAAMAPSAAADVRTAGGDPAGSATAAADTPWIAPPAPTALTPSPAVPTIIPITPLTPIGPVTPATPVVDAASWFSPSLQEATCAAASGDWRQVNHESRNGRSTIRMSRRGCDLEVRLEGEVEFDADAIGIERLARGARIRMEEDDGRTERYLEVRPGPGGRPEFLYRVNGRAAAFDGQAQTWYRAVLLQLFRRAGFAAEQRVAAILARGGVAGVLEELDRIPSGYVQAKYIGELTKQAELNEDQYRTVIRTASRRVDSDHYMAEILKNVATHQPLTAALLDDFITASLTLASDHYRTEVLRSVLRSGRLSTQQVAGVLRAAGEMNSDHYRTVILKEVADRYALEPAFRPAYLQATASMDSDHYRTEVLKRLLARDDLSSPELADIVAAAAMLTSDHYRSVILKGVAQRGLQDPTLHRAFFAAAAGLRSDHYYRETMNLLLEQERVAPDLLVTVLDHARAELSSDHYLSELLLTVLRRHPVEGPVRDAFLGAMDSISSTHYRGRVADALLRAERD